ncbi:MAG TPA: ABC transporter ATP-binding protein, partial [Elusimicrobiales bacterium]|nr:ABC transporter ATP-binding protein [Elusimicrobiales bacterium]
TLTKIISGIISDYSGDVSVKNRNIRELSFFEMSKIVSYLPQKIFYDPDITVIESLISVLSKDFTFEFGPKQKKQIEKAIDRFALHEIKDKKLSEISGGELQRVFIAMSGVRDCEFYVFDEPLNNLDIKNQIDIMSIIKSFSFERTVIAVVHDINMALKFADEIVFMKNGDVLFQIEPLKVSEDMIKKTFDIDCNIINAPKNEKIVLV